MASDESNDRQTSMCNLIRQNRTGYKLNFTMTKVPRCLIIAANCFPSILWLLDLSSAFTDVYVYMLNIKNCEKIVEFLWKEKVKIIREERDVLDKVKDFGVCKIGFGDLDSLWGLWLKANVLQLQRSILVCPYNRLRNQQFQVMRIKWTRFNHAHLGGLTSSRWLVGIPTRLFQSSLMSLISNLGLTRNVYSIVDEGMLGEVCDPNTDPERLANWKSFKLNEKWCLPSYRSRTGWVNRSFSFKEKALLLDVKENVIKFLANSVECSDLKSLIEQGDLIPGKISQVVTNWMLHLWGTPSLDGGNLIKPIVEESSQEMDSELTAADISYLQFEKDYLTGYGQKASKNDDEKVPVELWDRYILRSHFSWLKYGSHVARALNIIRKKIAFRWFLFRLRSSLFVYLRNCYGAKWWLMLRKEPDRRKRKRAGDGIESHTLTLFQRDVEVGRDAIFRAANSSWWEWSHGSSCYFWRFPKDLRSHVRDGFPIYIEKALPRYRQRQTFRLTAAGLEQLKDKVEKVVHRGYVEEGYVGSLINYFAVPKGEGDIRVVYDGTKCGLNQCVWAPNFFLPSVDSLLMKVSKRTWFSDMDLGEMFLNFYLDRRVRPFAGVDVTSFKNSNSKVWLRWNRTLMGFKASPYIACKVYGWVVDIARGNPKHASNPFKWNSIRINLPGSEDYDPTLPWIAKMDGSCEACDLVIYVDDVRPFGSSEARCRAAGKHIAKITQFFGLQDAPRKYRPPSQTPGPWCGSFVCVKDESVLAYVSQKKWDKGRSYIAGWLEIVQRAVSFNEVPCLEHKQMEQGRGFLVYLSRTYTSIVPYLKGIHLTLDSWRSGRDRDGWKMRSNGRRNVDLDQDVEMDHQSNVLFKSKPVADTKFKAPKFVRAVPRLLDDLIALNYFFNVEVPPRRFVRGKNIYLAKYGFGDASKAGFGSTFQSKDGISFRYGTWSSDGEEQTSNFRELENLAQALELESTNDGFKGAEVFIFTDNSTAEAAYYKGTSSSKLLFHIVLRLRKLEFMGGFIYFIHVAGSRMISQGTDGLSRGDFSEGVMCGSTMMSFIPIHLTALARSSTLKGWIESLITPSLKQSERIEFLDESGWFYRGHDLSGGRLSKEGIWMPDTRPGIFVWCPAPAAAQVAVEQLREARNKRTQSLHVVVLPRLFTSLWRRQLNRVADLFVEIPFIEGVWEKQSQHEPLTLAFIFPFLKHSPWQLRRTGAFLEMGRMLSKMWKETEVSTGFILCKLLSRTRSLETLSERMVCQMLCSPERFRIFHNAPGE